MPPAPLPPDKLYRVCDPATLGFKTTDEVPDLDEILGQPRAVEAVRFGIDIRSQGYNVFVLGPQGAGRYTLIGEFLRRTAAAEPKPNDWCYVFNFDEPHKPKALRLPPRQAEPFRAAMAQLVEDLRAGLPAAFEAEGYQARRGLIEGEIKERHEAAFKQLREEAHALGLVLGQTPGGFVFIPARGGQPLTPEVMQAMHAGEREKIEASINAMEQKLEGIMRLSQAWQKQTLESLRTLNRQVAQRLADSLIEPLKRDFSAFPDVQAYLDAVRDDIVHNIGRLMRAVSLAASGGSPPGSGPGGGEGWSEEDETAPYRRYQVNVIVHNDATPGAPVVFEDLPSAPNLTGRVEHAARFGQLVSDFTLIKPGALHKANGGYLVIDVRKLLMQSFAYEELKRALLARQIKIEPLSQRLGYAPIATLEPEPIPLELKVVLVGDPMLYYLLSAHDPEFHELFKVQAELADRMDHTPAHLANYARLIATLVRREKLKPFTAAAVARLVELSARMVEDRDKLSARFAYILDWLREADYWAGEDGAKHADAKHVEQAIAARLRRADHIREVMHEQILRGHVLVDTAGAKAGQVNGLSVLQLGDFAFGKPSRITARVRMGRGEVVDIERRVELGGPLHSKGVLILAGYLGAKFAPDRPLALSATLVFEQSYGGVDGDSASSAELYALISALADVPIQQNFAVTGSVNQFGQVQAIGGVNEKIEGFFDVCSGRGLNGDEGVLIPASNVVNLMLRKDVVEAVRAGRFRIVPVGTIDEGLEILTGMTAGEAGPDGAFPAGTVNARASARIEAFAAAARRFALPAPEGEDKDEGKKGRST